MSTNNYFVDKIIRDARRYFQKEYEALNSDPGTLSNTESARLIELEKYLNAIDTFEEIAYYLLKAWEEFNATVMFHLPEIPGSSRDPKGVVLL